MSLRNADDENDGGGAMLMHGDKALPADRFVSGMYTQAIRLQK